MPQTEFYPLLREWLALPTFNQYANAIAFDQHSGKIITSCFQAVHTASMDMVTFLFRLNLN